jgi:hypothetical protein
VHYLVTLAILVASELFYCLVLIGMDARIIGQVNMTGPPVTAWEVARLTALVSATYFALFAGAFVWLHGKLRNNKIPARCLLPVLYVACWVAVAYATNHGALRKLGRPFGR